MSVGGHQTSYKFVMNNKRSWPISVIKTALALGEKKAACLAVLLR